MKELTENSMRNFTLDTFPGVTLSDGGTCYKLIDCRDYADDGDWTFTEVTGLDEDDNEVTEKVTVDRPTEGFRLLPIYSYTYDADRDVYIDEGGEDTADTEDDEIDFADDVYGGEVDEWCKEAAEKEAEELRYANEVTDVSDLVGLCVSDSGADMLGIK